MGKVTRRAGPGRVLLEGLVKDADRYSTKVGWVGGNEYPEDRGGIPVAYAAAIAEYGYPEGGIPARPIMGPTVSQYSAEWRGMMVALMKQITAGKLTLHQAYNRLGLVASGDLKKTISQVTSPALAESTIAARARRKNTTPDKVNRQPLRDEGIMINTATHEVGEK